MDWPLGHTRQSRGCKIQINQSVQMLPQEILLEFADVRFFDWNGYPEAIQYKQPLTRRFRSVPQFMSDGRRITDVIGKQDDVMLLPTDDIICRQGMVVLPDGRKIRKMTHSKDVQCFYVGTERSEGKTMAWFYQAYNRSDLFLIRPVTASPEIHLVIMPCSRRPPNCVKITAVGIDDRSLKQWEVRQPLAVRDMCSAVKTELLKINQCSMATRVELRFDNFVLDDRLSCPPSIHDYIPMRNRLAPIPVADKDRHLIARLEPEYDVWSGIPSETISVGPAATCGRMPSLDMCPP